MTEPMVQELLTEQRTHQLFSEHALLFGDSNAIPVSVAINLLGEEAFNNIFRHKREDFINMWVIHGERRVEDDFSVDVLSLRGFCHVATYYNVLRMREQARAKQAKKENAV